LGGAKWNKVEPLEGHFDSF